MVSVTLAGQHCCKCVAAAALLPAGVQGVCMGMLCPADAREVDLFYATG
jgi:hypothetical protein